MGSVFSETDPVLINSYQRDAVENSRLGIPILFAFDTIHGFRTIFPIPLGTASSFDPERRADRPPDRRLRVGGGGLKQIYSPMVDLSHEPRWGRIAEAAGEDPVPQLRDGRGAREGRAGPRLQRAGQGRDERQALRRLRRARRRPRLRHHRHVAPAALELLPAALQGGGRCRFRHADVLVQRDQRRARAAPTATWRPEILKRRWGFDGFVESDYTAVAELRACPGENPAGGPCGHGVAEDGAEAARLALNAGTDSEMVSTNFRDFGRRARGERRGLDAPHQRCGPPHPAGEVPRRPVREPVRRRRARRRASSCCPRTAPRRGGPPGARWCC